MKDEHANFLGTYFDKDVVLRLAKASKVLAWIVLGVYGLQLLVSLVISIVQIKSGFWAGMTIGDVFQNLLNDFEQPLHGVVYFFALLGISQLLLIFLDVEDNTRRSARSEESEINVV